jgi:hypothetical protein
MEPSRTDRGSRKARNLAANASVVVHLENGDEAVALEGQAMEATDPALLSAYVAAYKKKVSFRPDRTDRGPVDADGAPEAGLRLEGGRFRLLGHPLGAQGVAT